MSIGNNIKKKILDNSDSFNYYKYYYEVYKHNYEQFLKNQNNLDFHSKEILINRLISIIAELNKKQAKIDEELEYLLNLSENSEHDINKCKNEFKNTISDLIKGHEQNVEHLNNQINDLNKNIKNKTNEINSLHKNITRMNNELSTLRKPFTNFDEYLIEAYSFPLVRPPFSQEAKHVFSVMENVAKYLISKTEKIENKPLISVIMPVYNRKDVVMNAIDSVLAQTYDNFELIVVDDASTDGTTELLEGINNEKVKVIFHETNKFASGARNTGLKHSKGEYIAYLDSDNLLDEKYLAATVGAFLELPDAGGIYSAQYRYETYDSKPFAVQFGSFNKSLLHNHNFIDMNCFAHRREAYEKIGGFDETLKGADDWELILKISNHFKIYSVPFLLSKCYLGIVDNRVSDLIPTDMGKIRSQNEMLPTKSGKLRNKVTIIIPIYDDDYNIKECVESILSLNLNNIRIIISNNTNINLNYWDEFKYNNLISLIQFEGEGFTNALNKGLENSSSDSDILILHQNAILTEGSLESLQKYAYDLPDCGLVVSQQILKNGQSIKKHVPYAHDDYWCDINASYFHKNILKIPIFHSGEVLELKMAPFFCTYIKRDVLNKSCGFDETTGKHFQSVFVFSEYIRKILGLKIYHIFEACVINNATQEDRNKPPINEYDFNFKNTNEYTQGYIWDF